MIIYRRNFRLILDKNKSIFCVSRFWIIFLDNLHDFDSLKIRKIVSPYSVYYKFTTVMLYSGCTYRVKAGGQYFVSI